jgi:hypothetical protein
VRQATASMVRPMSQPVLKIAAGLAGLAAVVALAIALVGGGSSSTAASVNPAPAAAVGQPAYGGGPGRAPRGFGTPVTGDAAAKVKAAVLAKYPGTIEHIMQLPDGSYVAHVITGSGEVHVLVSTDDKVTGVQQGGRPPGATQS